VELEIEGPDDTTACGQVARLDVGVVAPGDVGVSEPITDRANLSVAGLGDIMVRGSLPQGCYDGVIGSGKIKFR
jgi:hypothetical protein